MGQQFLQFPSEPLHHSQLREPPYRRPDAEQGRYSGISPREAFFLVNDLLALDMGEVEIAPTLVSFMQKNRWTVAHLLKQLEQNGIAMDADQQARAFEMHALLETLTALETAWHLYELNVSPLREQERKPSGDCLILIQSFRRQLGKFRSAMPAVHRKNTA